MVAKAQGANQLKEKSMENTERDGALTKIQREGCTESIGCECSIDHLLPDYMPEIRKILRVEARLCPGGKYADGERVEFAGSVVYTLLYTDGEGKLSSVSLTADYSFRCPYRCEEEVEAYASSRIENTVCRLGGPRKISLRSSITSRVHLLLPESIVEQPCGGEVECLTRHTSVRECHASEGQALQLSDVISCEGIAAEGVRPLLCDGRLAVRECRAEEAYVRVRGEAYIRLLAVCEDGRLLSHLRKLPFEEELPLSGVGAGDMLLGEGSLGRIDLSVNEIGDGDSEIALDIEGELSLLHITERPISYTEDAYSETYPTVLMKKNTSLCRIPAAFCGFFSVSGQGPLPEETIVAIPDAEGVAILQRVEIENRRPVLHGEVRVRALCEVAGETPAYTAAEWSFPFRIEGDMRLEEGQEPRLEAEVRLLCLRPRQERDGMAADAELGVRLLAYTEEGLAYVEGVSADKENPYEKRVDEIAVVYPEEGETLWSLAKRVSSTPAALCRLNQLELPIGEDLNTTHSLNGVAYVLVK